MTIDLKSEKQFDHRSKFLADLAAHGRDPNLVNSVQHTLEQSLANVLIEDEREPNTEVGQKPYGKSLADVADQLWDVDESTRFINVVHIDRGSFRIVN